MAIRAPYLRVIGIHANTGAEGSVGVEQMGLTDAEVERYEAMARNEAFYDTFTQSIAPSIYGNEGKFLFFIYKLPSLFIIFVVGDRAVSCSNIPFFPPLL